MQSELAEALFKRVQQQLTIQYPFLSRWSVSFDKAKRRAGVCKVYEKNIGISHWHVTHNSESVVLDTVLHEFAHAISYELFNDLGHGPNWKRVAKEIGAVPKATGRFKLPDSPWMLVTFDANEKSIEKIAPRFRRSKNIKHYYIKGNPATKGKLFFIRTEELIKYESNLISFDEIQFIQ